MSQLFALGTVQRDRVWHVLGRLACIEDSPVNPVVHHVDTNAESVSDLLDGQFALTSHRRRRDFVTPADPRHDWDAVWLPFRANTPLLRELLGDLPVVHVSCQLSHSIDHFGGIPHAICHWKWQLHRKVGAGVPLPPDVQQRMVSPGLFLNRDVFDEQPEHHKRVAEMVLERAKRLVEQKKDLVILLDSITRLARAYNVTIPAGGRTLSGGLDPSALYMPKKFFGAARNVEEGGSLTVLATALVDTGSKMDDVIFEEFKGTGNMELVLDRRMAERRIFPSIDILRSGTRREEMLLSSRELEAMYTLREMSGRISSAEFTEQVMDLMVKSPNNQEFVESVVELRPNRK